MKKLFISFLAILFVFTAMAFASCGNNNKGESGESVNFTWLETKNQTREIGTSYNMSGIWGKYGENYINPEITVTKDGSSVEFDAENKVLSLRNG